MLKYIIHKNEMQISNIGFLDKRINKHIAEFIASAYFLSILDHQWLRRFLAH